MDRELLQSILHFVVGPVHKVLNTLILVTVLNTGIDLFLKKGFKASVKNLGERLFAYTILIIVANRIDDLLVNDLFGWQGSTQFLVCLALVSRELKVITTYIYERFGIRTAILDRRLDDMAESRLDPSYRPPDNPTLDHQIERVQKDIEHLNDHEPTI